MAQPLAIVETPYEKARREKIEAQEFGEEIKPQSGDETSVPNEEEVEGEEVLAEEPVVEEVPAESEDELSADYGANEVQGITSVTPARQIDRLFKEYSSHLKTRRMITAVKQNRVNNPGRYRTSKMTYCYRAVKDALQMSGYASYYLPGVSASKAGPELVKINFVNVLKSNKYSQLIAGNPRRAPKGAILVYGGGSKKHGHIEIKTTHSSEASRFESFNVTLQPANGLWSLGLRPLLGVYVHSESIDI